MSIEDEGFQPSDERQEAEGQTEQQPGNEQSENGESETIKRGHALQDLLERTVVADPETIKRVIRPGENPLEDLKVFLLLDAVTEIASDPLKLAHAKEQGEAMLEDYKRQRERQQKGTGS